MTEPRKRSPLGKIADRIATHPRMYDVVSALLDVQDETGDKAWARCINPGHIDNDPSMVIYREDNHVHCFACGYHRSAIGVIMDATKRDFPSAMEYALGYVDPRDGQCRTPERVVRASPAAASAAGPDRITMMRELEGLRIAAENAAGTDQAGPLVEALRQRMSGFLTAVSASTMASDLGFNIEDTLAPYRPKFSPMVGRYHETAVDAANRVVQDFFVESLHGPRGGVARRYLEGRGIEPGTIGRFGIGYCLDERTPTEIVRYAKSHGVSMDDLVAAGVCGVAQKDATQRFSRFRGRLTLPISDTTGKIVGFSGRDLTGQAKAKYVNSPETEAFHKGDHLYGFHLARTAIVRHGSVIVVEGYADVWALHAAGIENAVAVMGTALTDAQAVTLAKCGMVYLAFDRDTAGARASLRSFPVLLANGCWPYVLDAQWSGKDPGDYLGGDLGELIAAAVFGAEDAYPLYRDWIEAAPEPLRLGVLTKTLDPLAYAAMACDFRNRDFTVPAPPRTIGGFALR